MFLNIWNLLLACRTIILITWDPVDSAHDWIIMIQQFHFMEVVIVVCNTLCSTLISLGWYIFHFLLSYCIAHLYYVLDNFGARSGLYSDDYYASDVSLVSLAYCIHAL